MYQIFGTKHYPAYVTHLREERFEEVDQPKIKIKLVASEQRHDDVFLSKFNIHLRSNKAWGEKGS